MNKDFEKIKCVVCGSNENKVLFIGKDAERPISVVICRKCGLIYLNPRWTKKKYIDFYDTGYDKEHRSYLTGEKKKDLSERAVVVDSRVDFLDDYREVLDIGTGDGSMLEFFRNKYSNVSVSAIEPSAAGQKVLAEKQIKIIASDIDSDWYLENKNKFDLIVLRQTLEHFLNPLEALKKIQSTLSTKGILYISVPNMMLPRSDNLLEKSWFIISHTYYFSKNTLLSLISQSGMKSLKVVDIDCELWGVFKKGDFEFDYANNYMKQRLALYKQKVKYLVKKIIKRN